VEGSVLDVDNGKALQFVNPAFQYDEVIKVAHDFDIYELVLKRSKDIFQLLMKMEGNGNEDLIDSPSLDDRKEVVVGSITLTPLPLSDSSRSPRNPSLSPSSGWEWKPAKLQPSSPPRRPGHGANYIPFPGGPQ
jgi:hypothetical protein